MRQLLDKIKRYWALALSIVGLIGQLTSIIGYLSSISKYETQGLFSFFKTNYLIIWISSLTIIVIAIFYWIFLINRRFLLGFTDTFKKRLNINWDNKGAWTIADDRILVVVDSDEGGITKKGADWENYTFTFRAKILNGRFGVIIRANDFNDYYMLQINPNAIVPHRRISFPKILNTSIDPIKGLKIEMQVGWELYNNLVVNLSRELVDWFDVRVKVNGQSVSMYINDSLEFQHDSFLQNSKGKVGFRCSVEEKALIKKVKVRLNS